MDEHSLLQRADLSRVFCLVDLDCFYAQVEAVRHNIPPDVPLGVQQWDMLIANNYPSRKYGVTRLDSAADALKKCPDIVLIHVDTICDEDDEGEEVTRDDGAKTKFGPKQTQKIVYRGKVSLEPYRNASKKVLEVFQKHLSPKCIERASIDEAYFDLTEEIEKRLCYFGESPFDQMESDELWSGSNVLGQVNPLTLSESDKRLLVACRLVKDIREDVKATLSYTCSAGIAHNKMVAKLISSKNKPDGQTVCPWRAMPDLMNETPLRKIHCLGGLLGKEIIKNFNIQTAGEMQLIPLKILVEQYGHEKGEWLYMICRGIDERKLVERQNSKSMLAEKHFAMVKTWGEVELWMKVLCRELNARMKVELETQNRDPQTLAVHFTKRGEKRRTVSGPMPANKRLVEPLVESAMRLLQRRSVFPLIHLGVQASKFKEIEMQSNDISNFFAKQEGNGSLEHKYDNDTQNEDDQEHEQEQPEEEEQEQGMAHERNTKNGQKTLTRSSTEPIMQPGKLDSKTSRNEKGCDIANYFGNVKEGSTIICELCHKSIPVSEQLIHSDWHFAKQVANSGDSEVFPPNPNSLKRPRGATSIQSYFQKKKDVVK